MIVKFDPATVHKNRWLQTRVELKSEYDFEIEFAVQRTQSGEAFIGIDDIKIFDGSCTGNPIPPDVPPPGGNCIITFDQVITHTCFFITLIENSLSCDFEEHHFCLWMDVSDQEGAHWKVGSASNGSSISEGPDHDHTLENSKGNYLRIHSSDHNRSIIATLTSPVMERKDEICFSWWHYMSGSNEKSLMISVDENSTGKSMLASLECQKSQPS